MDFYNVAARLALGGVILLHDTDPVRDELINSNGSFCATAHKIVSYLEDHGNYNILTLPVAEFGLSIVTRKDDTRTMRRHNEIEDY